MSSSQSPKCEKLPWEQFLQESLGDLESQELERHLTECKPCRQRLERVAADESYWIEASKLLESRDELASQDRCQSQEPGLEDPVPYVAKTVLDSLAPSDDPNSLGRLGVYEVTGVVGIGGMGVVLKAHDPSLERSVAIKVLAPHLAMSGAARRRFEREAKAAACVIHPNVIAIHSVSNTDRLPYLVMPYVRGASLQKRISREGALPVADLLRIGGQIAAGLAAAHEQGLVHRDIKPANILLEEGVERVSITDFGLARAVDDAAMTRSGAIVGTPQFMSPEQADGYDVDARSDLFSLGSVLYTLCTGRPPFRAPTSLAVLRLISETSPRPIAQLNPEVPGWLCKLVERLLCKSPAQRFQSAEEVAQLLRDGLAHFQNPQHALPEKLAVQASPLRSADLRRWGTVLGLVVSVLIFGFFVVSQVIPLVGNSKDSGQAAQKRQSANQWVDNQTKSAVAKNNNHALFDWGDGDVKIIEEVERDTKLLLLELGMENLE